MVLKYLELAFSPQIMFFLIVVILLYNFKSVIKEAILRGGVKVKFAGNEISIGELAEQLDGEMKVVTSETDDRVTELEEQLKCLTEELSNNKAIKTVQTTLDNEDVAQTLIETVKSVFDLQPSDTNLATIIFHLGGSKFTWRTLKTLKKRTGLSKMQIDRCVNKRAEVFLRSNNKNGRVIYRLQQEFQTLYMENVLRSDREL